MNTYKGEKYRIVYNARASATGLTDVKITIWKPDGTKLVESVAMSELGDGLYYYDIIPDTVGVYHYKADSASKPLLQTGSFNVVENVWDEDLDKHKEVGTMGYRIQHIASSFSRQPRFYGGWEQEEKAQLLNTLKDISEKLSSLEARILANEKAVIKTESSILEFSKQNIDTMTLVNELKQHNTELENLIREYNSSISNKFDRYISDTNRNLIMLAKALIKVLDTNDLELLA